MSKYIHPKLDHFLKRDSRLIKAINPKLKKSEILNSLSKIFGWRHYNELVQNLNKDSFSEEFVDISKMEFDELSVIKSNYFEIVYKLFPVDERFFTSDPYNILDNPFYNLMNKKTFTINKGLGEKLKINLCYNESYIKLENKDVEDLIELIIERNSYGDASSSMWFGRSKMYISILMKAFKNDKRTLDFQEEFIKCFSFNYLVDYFKYAKSTIERKYISGLATYINMMPGYIEEKNILPQTCNEQHGYLVMMYHIFNKGFLKRSNNNKVTYRLSELREYKGEIEFEYFEHRDYYMEIKTFEKLILKK